jgi:hypothetical protein
MTRVQSCGEEGKRRSGKSRGLGCSSKNEEKKLHYADFTKRAGMTGYRLTISKNGRGKGEKRAKGNFRRNQQIIG